MKEKLWQQCSDLENNKENFQEYRHECSGLVIVPQHYDLVEPYFDKYYEIIRKLIESSTISQSKATYFNSSMCPLLLRMDAKKQADDLVKV